MNQDLTDASIQVRVSRKTLATLAMWFYDNGDKPRSLSELARNSMEILKDMIVIKGFVPQVESSLDATKSLEAIGLGNLTIRSKGRGDGMQNYLKQLQNESLIHPGDPFGPIKRKGQRDNEEVEKEILEAAKTFADKDEEIKRALASVPEESIVEE